ncbi:MAG: 2-dehydro-3-deoxyphosphooctonate aldolase [Proteobacteria bacterium]|nr:MAG: 2-dehydro-3-deoxyphosphooctonate aldolase [Pseudomonadota bacterium]|tara:strand:+ start:139 stop:984 length:846 start_codon:yes stop_codon:yes gene_type:complete
MEQKSVFLGNIEFNNEKPFVLIAGPCAIEDRETVFKAAEELTRITKDLGIPYIFKSSFDKANRTSTEGKRGVGIEEGLKILAEVKETFGVPVITDIHDPNHVEQVAEVVDMLQIPAFLCRQMDLTEAAAKTGKPVNVKKGQFLAPGNMKTIMDNYIGFGNENALQCERGTTFGHNGLVVDFAGFRAMKENGHPIIMDATHAAQIPGGNGTSSGGKREVVVDLAKAALATGVAGVFLEVHPDVENAISDKANQVPLEHAEELITQLKQVDDLIKSQKILNIK